MAKQKKTVVKEVPEIRTVDRDTGEVIVTPAKLALVDEMVDSEYKPFFKTPWNHDTDSEAVRTGTLNLEESKCQKHEAEETRIDTILRRYGITGPEQLAPPPPSLSEIPDHWDMETVIRIHRDAVEAFEMLPADVRYRFQNDVARYVGEVDALRKAGAWESLKSLGIDVVGLEPPPTKETGAPKTPPQTEPAK